MDNSVCFIGHRNIAKTDELIEKLNNTIENLITNENVCVFMFGSKSKFDDICYEVVTSLKEKYPHITRLYVRAEYPYINADYKNYLLQSYEDTYFPDKLIDAGKYYTLTEDRIPYMRDKTSNEQFFILTLFAIASELEYSGQYVPGSTANIELAIGLPPGHYGKQYKEFEKYFERNTYINFEYKGTKYKIFISSAVSYPQGYAAIVPKIDEIKNYSRAMIIDIGGFSLDYLQIKNGIADMSVCDSLEMGVITFYNDIKSSINSSEDILIDESDIDAIILGKDSVFEQKIKALIEAKAQEFTDKIINSLRERKIDLKSTHAIFTGGGSILLKKYILSSPKIAKPDIIDDIRANAKGYDIMLRRQPGRM